MSKPAQKNEPVKLKPAPPPQPGDSAALQKRLARGRRMRRALMLASFVLVVVIPSVLSGIYLFARAADQYHSRSAFAVRSEEMTNPLDIVGAFTQTGMSSAPDAEILNDFISSQSLVTQIDADLDLRTIFNRPDNDPVFTLGDDPSVEDLLGYWDRMVTVSLDSNTGVIEIEARAFDREDARLIANAIIERSADLVEDLSRIAREDSMRFTIEDVAKAEERLREQRVKIREFRTNYQIIDPEADVESQVGVIAALQGRLADALIEFDTIRSYADNNDPRLPNIQLRIDAIRNQIGNERAAFSNGSETGRPLSDIIGEYEELLVDMEFSQNAYTAALAAEEQARIEANRRSRYLAVHIPPTLAEESVYPQRALLLAVVIACTFATWAIMVMLYYNVRDRR